MLACKRRLTTRVVSLEPCGLSQNRAEKEATVAKSCLSAQTSHQAEEVSQQWYASCILSCSPTGKAELKCSQCLLHSGV